MSVPRARSVEGLPSPGRTLVMGVLNVTPDSFSDGGRFSSSAEAVDHALDLAEQGADIIDVGGESTRPGAIRPSTEEELSRVIPVIGELAGRGVTLSIDTMRSVVARAAVEAGARLVNDVSGGLADPEMLGLIAELDVPCVLMHWRGHSERMHDLAAYDDVVTDVVAELGARLAAALAAGIPRERIALDPGLGFAKTPDHNWSLLARIDEVMALGQPLVLGASRKRFLGDLLADAAGNQRDPAGRDDATLATSTLAAAAGVWCVRVHAVGQTVDAVRVVQRIAEEGGRWPRPTR